MAIKIILLQYIMPQQRSGKTYTLVKEYLKILFQSNNSTSFLSAYWLLRFTNKAVAEMKERIIDTLKKFSR